MGTEGVVTDRHGYRMRGVDGSSVDVLEWLSANAIALLATVPVAALWAEVGACCDYAPLSPPKESQQVFAEFDAVEL